MKEISINELQVNPYMLFGKSCNHNSMCYNEKRVRGD